jgi:serine/threonine protein kinase
VLKRIDCIDRRIYDAKVFEYDTFMRFRSHPNLVQLYSYWSEKASSPYQYKSLVALFEEGVFGDLLKSVVLNPIRPSSRLVQKYICDIAKGLLTLHSCNIIHGSVKPSSIYIKQDNTAILGEIGKVELDAARHTHQLFSRVLI